MSANENPLSSVPSWLGKLFAQFVSFALTFGLLAVFVSAPFLLVLSRYNELAASFGWLAVVGVFLVFLNPTLDEDDTEIISSLLEDIDDSNRFELSLYFTIFFLVLVSGMGLLVSATGVAAMLIVEYTGFGGVAIATAVFYPYIDTWIGNQFDINVTSIGGLITAAILTIVVKLIRVDSKITRSAANSARSFTQSP